MVSKRRRRDQVPCWVVEDHNEALPVIHLAIRRKLLAFRDLSMLHIGEIHICRASSALRPH